MTKARYAIYTQSAQFHWATSQSGVLSEDPEEHIRRVRIRRIRQCDNVGKENSLLLPWGTLIYTLIYVSLYKHI